MGNPAQSLQVTPNKELLYLGVGLVVSNVIAWGAILLAKRYPKVDRKIWAAGAGVLIGAILIVLAYTGLPSLPGSPDIERVVTRIVPGLGICLWAAIVVYVALSTKGLVEDLAKHVGANLAEMHLVHSTREVELNESLRKVQATLDVYEKERREEGEKALHAHFTRDQKKP